MKVKIQPTESGKCLKIMYLLNVYYPKYIKTLTSQQQDKHPNQKMGKGLEEVFLQMETQMLNKHMRKYATS